MAKTLAERTVVLDFESLYNNETVPSVSQLMYVGICSRAGKGSLSFHVGQIWISPRKIQSSSQQDYNNLLLEFFC